jgi:lipooligosaccharide transport system permease protein
VSLVRNISWRSWDAWRRNKDVFLKTWKTNFLPPFIEPILYLLAMGFSFGAAVTLPPYEGREISYVAFLAPGLVAISIMNNSFYECTYGSFVRMHYQKTFDAMIATPLSIEDVMIGEVLWGATKAMINASIVLVVIAAVGAASFPGLLLIPVIAFFGGLMFSSMALIFTAIVPNIDSYNYPFFLFITPMFLLSGTFFPLSLLPSWAAVGAYALPLTHVTTLTRDLCLNMFTINSVISIVYIAVLALVLTLTAVFMMKRRLIR